MIFRQNHFLTAGHLAGLLLLLSFYPVKMHFGDGNLPPLDAMGRVWINTVFLILSFTTFMLYFRHAVSFSKSQILIFVICGIWVAMSYPIFSGDLNEYLMRGRIWTIHGMSPYSHFPREFPQDLFADLSVWKDAPQSYGPISAYLQGIAIFVSQNSIWGPTWCFKLLTLLGVAGTTWGIGLLADRLEGFDRNRCMMLFSLNPFVWVSFILDGHNDIFMILFLVFSVYFLSREQNARSMLFLALGFLCKYTAVYVAPLVILMAMKQEWRKHHWGSIRWGIKVLIVNLIVVAAAYYPFRENIADHFTFLVNYSKGFYTNSVPYAIRQVLEFAGLSTTPEIMTKMFGWGYLALYGILMLLVLRMKPQIGPGFMRILSLALLGFCFQITSAWSQWYLIWAFPWLIFSRWPLNMWLYYLLTQVGVFAYFKRVNYLLLIALTLYVAALGLSGFNFRRKIARG
jgi:hypothetical protein